MTYRSPRTAVNAVLVSVLLWSLTASPVRAGETARNLAGQRVRVTAAAPAFTGTIVGTLVKESSDHLIVVDPKTGAVTELPLSSVTQIEVSQPRTRAKLGALIGLGMGVAAASLAAGSVSGVGCGDPGGPYVDCEVSDSEAIGVGVAVGVFYGAIGYWLGAKSKVDVWSDASAGRLKISLAPLRDGGRASLSFSF